MESTNTQPAAAPSSSEEYFRLRRKYRLRGVLWLVIPTVSLVAIISAYVIVTVIITGPIGGDGSGLVENVSVAAAVARLVRTVLSIIGLVSGILLILGVPLGIVYLVKRVPADGVTFDERSGKGDASVVPEEIKGWNWGAAGLPIIWGLAHRVWIGLLNLIPVVNVVWWIVMGLKGSEWAWRKEQWISVADFKEYQQKWKIWGIIFFVLSILGTLGQLAE